MKLTRYVRESNANMIKSAMTMRGWSRALWLRAAQNVPPAFLERMRGSVREEIARQDRARLGL
jgi:hypothetical protein